MNVSIIELFSAILGLHSISRSMYKSAIMDSEPGGVFEPLVCFFI